MSDAVNGVDVTELETVMSEWSFDSGLWGYLEVRNLR